VTLFSSGHALAPSVPAFGADIRGFNGDELHGSGIAKPVERNAHTIQSSGFGIPQCVVQCGSSGSSCCSHSRRVLAMSIEPYATELGLVQAQLNELLAVVQLYQTLGGGWQQ
jgi:hypothetical protein